MNIIITGQNGYIARRLHAYLLSGQHNAKLIDMRSDNWRYMNYEGVDSIVHLAGIVHNSSRDPREYQRVNVELTADLARKALDYGVPQFIFVSTMAVYGKKDKFTPVNEITPQSLINPKTHYGKSKLSAEKEVQKIYGKRACIVRPPMVYGENCAGNYRKLRSLVLRLKVVPRYENRRGMIYIDNLCEFFRLLIENSGAGIFHPQDADYLPTYKLARLIGEHNGVKVLTPRMPFLKTAATVLPGLRKAFGSLSYAPDRVVFPFGEYSKFDIRAAVERTEKNWSS